MIGTKTWKGSVSAETAGKPAAITERYEGLLEPALGTNDPFVYYPYRPLLWPFVVDTTFFGSLSAFVWWLPGVIRGTVRRAGLRCSACGYQLRSRVQTCPECGREKGAA
jgi:hypothetical protein